MGSNPPDAKPKRDEWGNQYQFILACLGYAVGLGNVWRFPYLCGRNGGAAFLIPYFIMLFVAGLPIFYMELSIGQFAGKSPAIIYDNLIPIYSGIGKSMVIIQSITAIYYNMIMGWALFYLGMSFQSPLPWDHCTNHWNTKHCYDDKVETDCVDNNQTYFWGECYNVTDGIVVTTTDLGNVTVGNISDWLSSSHRKTGSDEFLDRRVLKRSDRIEEFGTPDWELTLCLLVAWILIFLCLCGGTKTSGKVVYFTATFPYLIILCLVIRGCTLDNAIEGIKFFIVPNVTLLATGDVWADAVSQIFFSLGLGSGGLTTLASYNNFNDNVFLHSFIVVIGNSLTSIFAAFAIFPVIGYLSGIVGRPVSEIAKDGITLAFSVYPNAIARIPLAPLWAVLFNFMLVLLAVDTLIVLTEVPVTSVLDTWPHLRRGWRKPAVVGSICLMNFVIGLLFTCPGGAYALTIMDNYAGAYPLLLMCLIEMGVVIYLYGVRNFIGDVRLMLGKPPNTVYKLLGYPVNPLLALSWVIVSPVALFVIMIFKFYTFDGDRYTKIVYLSICVPVALFVIMIFKFYTFDGDRYDEDYKLPAAASAAGWLVTMITILPVPIFAVVKIVQNYRLGLPFKTLLRPSPQWVPKTRQEDGETTDKIDAKVKVEQDNGITLKQRHAYSNDGFSNEDGQSFDRF